MKNVMIVVVVGLFAGLVSSADAQSPQDGPAAVTGLETLDFRQVVSEAKDKVFPALVFIKCVQQTHETGKKSSQEVSGSGVLVSAKGELLTNWHVVDKAIEIRCLLADGRHYDAEIVGTDKDIDLALVRLKMDKKHEPLPFAKLGDSSALTEGEFVMAMGAPWGMSRSVSIGIISCTRRYLPDNGEYSLWLQTDAAISPGNSGGPLVNTAGQVVGINTLGVMWGGDMGFSIPSNTIKQLLPQLRKHGKVNWSWTGLQLQPLRDFNRNIYFSGEDGVIVAETDPESPARRAGIEAGDRIMKIDGVAVSAVTEEHLPALRRRIGMLAKHKPVPIELLRRGDLMTVELTPREKGEVEGEELDCPRWDLTVKEINQFDNADLYFYRKQDVFIYGIKYPGNASNTGLRRNDILLKIENQKVQTLDDVKKIHAEAIENVKTKHRVLLSVLRQGLMRQVVPDFSRDYEKE